jgi:hypothetical protein
MFRYATSRPSTLPFMPYSTRTGIIPSERERATIVLAVSGQPPKSPPIRYR